MKNITTFLSKSVFKPERCMVYVHDIEGVKYAVATDDWRLAEEKLPELLQENMPVGYYTAKAWTEIAKAFNKKTMAISIVLDTINAEVAKQDRYKGYSYPKYRQLFPSAQNLVKFDGEMSFNVDFFKDFLDLIDTKFDGFSFESIKQRKENKGSGMIMYRDINITIVLMGMNK